MIEYKLLFLIGLFMPVSIDVVRKVQFARAFDWELNFGKNSGLISPFNTWFPAVEVDYGIADIQSQTFELPVGNINLPVSIAETAVRITFLDDYKGTIEKWLTAWLKSIGNWDKGMKPLDECHKAVKINRLSPVGDKTNKGLKTVLDTKTYLIYPDGTFNDNLSQNNQGKTFSMDFKIVG